jgi:hypothetical protein
MATIKVRLEGNLLARVKTAVASQRSVKRGEEAKFNTKQEEFFGTRYGAGVYNCLDLINKTIGTC